MNLVRTQFMSLVTKAVTMVLGIIQSIIVVRILSPSEFGLVGLVMSIGGVIGVSQHLGIVDGAIREIAVLKEKKEVGKVFWVSHLVRQAVTLPLSLGLLLLSGVVAVKVYGKPEIIPFIQIFAGVLILQGLQDVLGATLTGMKRFFSLYVIQIITAIINIVIFGALTWWFGIGGFFWSIVITTAVMVVLYSFVIAFSLKGFLSIPTWIDIRRYTGRVMRVGAYMYLSRIFFVIWQRLPLLVLGGVLATDQLGYINISLTFGSKLTIIAMALSEVNLSWMSSLFSNKRDEFDRVVTRNMQRVFVLMSLIALTLLFFSPEILRYVIGVQYLPAHSLILIVTLAFFLYSLIDIGSSSVFVSADHPRARAGVYALMTSISGLLVGWLLLFKPDALLAAYAVLAGAVVSYLLMVVIAKYRFGILLLTKQLIYLLAMIIISVVWLLFLPKLSLRILFFVLLSVYILREAFRSKLLPRKFNLLRVSNEENKVICFAGSFYEQNSWTNRQQIMSRISRKYPVLYVEPRIWLLRFLIRNWKKPVVIFDFFRKIFWYKRVGDLYIKAQWNLIPWSRERKWIARLNHFLNRWNILLFAQLLGFRENKTIAWIYDTEAAEYLSAFKRDIVVYDCVDDHAAQAGVSKSASLVRFEENAILRRADLVTVTSEELMKQKKDRAKNIHLVLNAGDVELFSKEVSNERVINVPSPIIGSVGALDSYKIDFDLIVEVAKSRTDIQFVFIGSQVVDQDDDNLSQLKKLKNVHLLGAVERRKVPAYVAKFDICMIPYKSNRYNKASFPLKFWEFMATGKPVIASGVPELKKYKNMISYVGNVEEFNKAINYWLLNKKEGIEIRKSEASKHSWQKRVDELLELLDNL